MKTKVLKYRKPKYIRHVLNNIYAFSTLPIYEFRARYFALLFLQF